MIIKASNNRKTAIVLAIALISLVAISSLLTGFFSQANFRISANTIVNQTPKQSSLSPNLTNITETNSLDAVNSSIAFPSMVPISSDPSKSTTYSYGGYTVQHPDPTQPFYPFYDNTNQGQIIGSGVFPPLSATDFNGTDSLDAANSNNSGSSASITAAALLGSLNFTTYTYGGYSVQQPDPNQLSFSFPDNTSQGQFAGSDAITVGTYIIQKMDFNATFVTPQINATGFDEMVIFAASDTATYKGTEFGVRMDLNDGFIYGYIQEPNGDNGDVNFQMWNLMPNDGLMHHYTLTLLGSGVSFCVDGTNYGYLNFPSKTNYSSLSFSILAVVHRFTDDWDSSGDNMIVENFSLNQQ